MVPQERFQGGNVTKPKTKATAQSLTRLERTLKVRYLGIGFLWAWVYGSFETFAVFPERAGIGINADSSWLASAVVVTLTLFVLGFVLGRRQTMAPPWLTVAAGVATAAGTLLSGLAAGRGDSCASSGQRRAYGARHGRSLRTVGTGLGSAGHRKLRSRHPGCFPYHARLRFGSPLLAKHRRHPGDRLFASRVGPYAAGHLSRYSTS